LDVQLKFVDAGAYITNNVTDVAEL